MPRKRRRKKKSNTLRRSVSAVMDFIEPLSFLIALVVQLIVMGISMSLLGYNLAIKIGFVSIGFVVVMFAVIAYMKGNKVLWALFAVTSIFFSWSFALVGTEAQTAASVEAVTIESDGTLLRLDSRLVEAKGERDAAQEQYDLPDLSGDHYDYWRDQLTYWRNQVDELQGRYDDRYDLIESGELTQAAQVQASSITADRIFTAMWRALFSGDVSRVIQWFIFGFIFIGVELTIITAIKERETKKEDPIPEPKQVKPEPTEHKQVVESSVLEEYARVSFGQAGEHDGYFPHQEKMLELAEGGKLSYAKIINITEEAVRRGLIVVENRKHRPADFISAADFLREMKK